MGVTSREINGFKFTFICTMGDEGILIDATQINLASSEYPVALNEAKRLHNTWQAVSCVVNESYVTKITSVGWNEEEFTWRRERALTALQQTDWELTETERALAERDLEYIDATIERRKEKKRIRREKVTEQKLSRPGYVYVLKSVTGNFKIGRAKDPANRLRTFEVKLPFEVEYECVIQTVDMVELERSLHQRFKDQHVNGEWFSLSPADVDYIKGLAT
jgi:hypothetical protein